ncbi:MAG TPA: FtsX-like permease family protein [Acidimicrobiales bacterium]|nr:FtsX-like permease family protein [Acidimicrobiales bacterium]
MFRLSVRQLLAHKIRFVMTSFAVVLGVSFVVGSLVVTDTVRRSFDTLFSEITAGVDLQVRSEAPFDEQSFTGNREPLPAELVDVVAGVDGVQVAEGGVGGTAQPVAPDGEPITTTGAPLLGTSWGATDRLYPVTLNLGEKPDAPGEIAFDQGTFEDNGYELGDQVDVLLPDGRETFTLVGTATFGESNSLAGAVLTMFEPGEAQRVFDSEGRFDEIYIGLDEGADVAEVRGAVAEALPDGVEVITGEAVAEEGADAVGEFADLFGNILLGFAAVALFVSAFYIYNTFSIILGQRVKELALLRAVGATARQIRRTVVLEALLVGVVSSVIGIGTGMLTAMGLRGLLNAGGFGLPADAMVLKASTVVTALVVGVGVTLAASVIPARGAARVSPMAALRDGVDATTRSPRLRLAMGGVLTAVGALLVAVGLFGTGGTAAVLTSLGIGAVLVFLGIAGLSPLVAGPVARVLGAPVARLLGEPGVLARENAARNPFRTASTASALVIGLALVTMASVVGTSVKDTFAAKIDRSVEADFVISESSFAGFSPRLADQLAGQPELDAVSGIRFGRFQFEGGTRDVIGVGTDGGELVDVDVQAGGTIADLGAEGIFVHEDPAEDLGLEPGDQVTVAFSATGEQTFTVVGIHADATFAGNYVISNEAWDANFTDVVDGVIMARAAEGVTPEAARAAVEEATAEFPQADIEDRQEFLDSQQAQVDQILVTVNVLLLLAVVIAVLGIANTLALSVFERTRELGLLRAVGMSRRQARRMVRWEAAIVSLFGAVLGVAVGVVFGYAATEAMPDSFLDRLAIPTGSLVGLLVLAVVAGLLAAIFPARRAARLDVLRAITTE